MRKLIERIKAAMKAFKCPELVSTPALSARVEHCSLDSVVLQQEFILDRLDLYKFDARELLVLRAEKACIKGLADKIASFIDYSTCCDPITNKVVVRGTIRVADRRAYTTSLKQAVEKFMLERR